MKQEGAGVRVRPRSAGLPVYRLLFDGEIPVADKQLRCWPPLHLADRRCQTHGLLLAASGPPQSLEMATTHARASGTTCFRTSPSWTEPARTVYFCSAAGTDYYTTTTAPLLLDGIQAATTPSRKTCQLIVFINAAATTTERERRVRRSLPRPATSET